MDLMVYYASAVGWTVTFHVPPSEKVMMEQGGREGRDGILSDLVLSGNDPASTPNL